MTTVSEKNTCTFSVQRLLHITNLHSKCGVRIPVLVDLKQSLQYPGIPYPSRLLNKRQHLTHHPASAFTSQNPSHRRYPVPHPVLSAVVRRASYLEAYEKMVICH